MAKKEAAGAAQINDREKVIVKTSAVGIAANVLLVAFKAAVGWATGSIAVILDAVNNLSDALSSVITILGAKLGARQPDKKHPLGYGRIEYLSSMFVAALVLYAGVTSLVESVKKIIHPEAADYSVASLVIIAAAVAVKLVLGAYVKKQGRAVNSGALIASGSDASFDAVLSASVLASAVVYMIWHVSLEAYVGVVIAGFIIKAGVEMMIETLNDILGHRGDQALVKQIKHLIKEESAVKGAYDLFLFNYGPEKDYGSVHVEVPDVMTADEIDRLTRRLQERVYRETGVILTGVGIYSHNTQNEEIMRIRDTVQKTVLAHDWALQYHGFYVDPANKAMRFDVVISFDVDREQALDELNHEMLTLYPGYRIEIVPDFDVSD